jgi:predicted RNA binding protein YcfA (HicA-like mRNA interferase family)
VSQWPAVKARLVLAALVRIGWTVKRQSGSHRTLARAGWADFVSAFHDTEEIGPKMLARIARRTGLQPGDLQPGLAGAIDSTSIR